jgi:hypothetical protein
MFHTALPNLTSCFIQLSQLYHHALYNSLNANIMLHTALPTLTSCLCNAALNLGTKLAFALGLRGKAQNLDRGRSTQFLPAALLTWQNRPNSSLPTLIYEFPNRPIKILLNFFPLLRNNRTVNFHRFTFCSLVSTCVQTTFLRRTSGYYLGSFKTKNFL